MRKYILKHAQMTITFDTKNNIGQLYFILGTAKLKPRNIGKVQKRLLCYIELYFRKKGYKSFM